MAHHHRGAGNNGVLVAVASLVVVAMLVWVLMKPQGDQHSPAGNGNAQTSNRNNHNGPVKLFMYCAAGMKLPVDAATKNFEREVDISLELSYRGSGTLLNNLQVAKHGDIYLAADTTYIEIAREKGLLDEIIPLAKFRPVIAVRKGNPKNIKSVADLLRDDVTFAVANPDAASIGKVTKKVLEKTGQWEAVWRAKKVATGTVNDIAAAIVIKSIDAGIVWDAIVRQDADHLDMINTPEFDAVEMEITAGVLKTCKHPAAALKYLRYLQAPKKGQREFGRFGYKQIGGDAWAERPVVTLFSGGVNRLAIQDTIEQFKRREGVEVITTFNGCGILVGQMKSNNIPDAYFACDASYMTQVRNLFERSLTVSETDMVIITRKGNPKNIKRLADLGREGISIGLANEKQSALGALTANLLKQFKLYDAVRKNVDVDTTTADLLVTQLIGGALDAAVVYRVNCSQVKDKLEIIPIDVGNPIAVQPIAVSRRSRYRYLTRRLVEAITTAESRRRFEAVDFRWRADSEQP
jgi:molybdenum ABC transporter molybdate-binding protein